LNVVFVARVPADFVNAFINWFRHYIPAWLNRLYSTV